MVNIWKSDSIRMHELCKYDSNIGLKFKTFAICMIFMSQWAVNFLDNSEVFKNFISLEIKWISAIFLGENWADVP